MGGLVNISRSLAILPIIGYPNWPLSLQCEGPEGLMQVQIPPVAFQHRVFFFCHYLNFLSRLDFPRPVILIDERGPISSGIQTWNFWHHSQIHNPSHTFNGNAGLIPIVMLKPCLYDAEYPAIWLLAATLSGPACKVWTPIVLHPPDQE